MKTTKEDIVLSKEVLNLFKNNVRIIDKKHLSGIIAIDIHMIERLKKVLPEMFDESIMKKYDISIGYTGKDIKKDFAQMGIEYNEKRIIEHIRLIGIPVPWQLLKKAGIDNQKFNVVLTPKQTM
jgi:hypothetical protein